MDTTGIIEAPDAIIITASPIIDLAGSPTKDKAKAMTEHILIVIKHFL